MYSFFPVSTSLSSSCSSDFIFKTGKMAQQLRVLAALAEDLGSISITSMEFTIFCMSCFKECNALFWPLWALRTHGAQICMQANHRYT